MAPLGWWLERNVVETGRRRLSDWRLGRDIQLGCGLAIHVLTHGLERAHLLNHPICIAVLAGIVL